MSLHFFEKNLLGEFWVSLFRGVGRLSAVIALLAVLVNVGACKHDRRAHKYAPAARPEAGGSSSLKTKTLRPPSNNLKDYVGALSYKEFSTYFLSRMIDLSLDNNPEEALRLFLEDPQVQTGIRMLANPDLDLSPLLEASPIYEKLLEERERSTDVAVRKRFQKMLERHQLSYEELVDRNFNSGIDMDFLELFKDRLKWLPKSAHDYLHAQGLTISAVQGKLTNSSFGFARENKKTELVNKIVEAYLGGLSLPEKRKIQKAFAELDNPSEVDLVIKALEVSGPIIQKLIQQYGEMAGDPIFREATRRFKEDIRPADFRDVRKMLQTQLESQGLYWDQVFASFDQNPIKAGTAAQVHRVEVFMSPREKPVELYLKVIRPDYRARVERDSEILRKTKVLEMGFQKDFVRNFALTVSIESNLMVEATRAQEAFRHYHRPAESVSSVRVVKPTYLQMSPDFYLMEKVAGVSFADNRSLEAEDYSRRLQHFSKGFEVWFRGLVFETGFFHGDPHLGNLMMTDSGLVFLDFGNSGQLAPGQQEGLRALFAGVHGLNFSELLRGIAQILASSNYEKSSHFDPVTLEFSEAFRADLSGALFRSGPLVSERFQAFLEVAARPEYELQIPISIWQLLRAFSLFDSSLEYLKLEYRKLAGESASPELLNLNLQGLLRSVFAKEMLKSKQAPAGKLARKSASRQPKMTSLKSSLGVAVRRCRDF